MSIFYSKMGVPRAKSFLYTNGKTLNLYKFPENDLNESLLNTYSYVRYAKKYDYPDEKAYEV